MSVSPQMSYTISISAAISSSPPKKSSCSTTTTFRGKGELPAITSILSSSFKESAFENSCSTSPPSRSARSPLSSPPIISSPRRLFKRTPEAAMGLFPRTSRSRSDSSSEMRPSNLLGIEDDSSSFHPMTTATDTFQALKLKAQKSIPMLRSHSSPASSTASSAASQTKGVRPSPLLFDSPRPSISSEETAIDFDSDLPLMSFRKRAKAALGRPTLTHSHSSPGIKTKPLPADDDVEESDSSTEVGLEEELGGDFSDNETVVNSCLPPKAWSPPVKFELLEPTTKHGSKHAPQPSFEVPYPLSYDRVLLECDDHTHDLIKALIPNRHGLSFHDFAKPPTSVLDLGCGEGRWVLEAAQQWKHTRFVGLDLMDIQPELSSKLFDDLRDRVQWVHSNFLHYRLPFEDGQFDYIRMSYLGLAIPGYKWKGLISEVRRVLKSDVGVLEWIDEDPTVLPVSSQFNGSESNHHQLEDEFRALLRSKDISGGRPRSLFKTVPALLKGRAMFAKCDEVARFNLALPGQDAQLAPEEGNEKLGCPPNARSPSRNGRPSLDQVSADAPAGPKPLPPLPVVSPSYHVPRGLVILPENKLIPLSPSELEAQATRNYQVLLGCRDSLWKLRLESDPEADRELFDDQIWDYQCGRYERLHLPQQTCCSWDDSDDELPAPSLSLPLSLSALNHRRRAPSPTPTPKHQSSGDKPTLVRSIKVFIAHGDGK